MNTIYFLCLDLVSSYLGGEGKAVLRHHFLMVFRVNETTWPMFNAVVLECTIKQTNKQSNKMETRLKHWNLRCLNLLPYNPITFTGVSKGDEGQHQCQHLRHTATSSYSLTVHKQCCISLKVTKVSTVSFSKLRLTLRLSMCIKAA